MPSGSTITLLTMYLKQVIRQMCKDTCIKEFITILSIVTKNIKYWTHPGYLAGSGS